MQQLIKKEMQVAIDEYLRVYKEYKRLEDALGELRQIIEPYMKEQALNSVEGSDGLGRLDLSLQQRPIMNARYTTYALEDMADCLTHALKKKCVVEVVDKDKLEALCKLGELPQEVLERKTVRASYSFIARLNK